MREPRIQGGPPRPRSTVRDCGVPNELVVATQTVEVYSTVEGESLIEGEMNHQTSDPSTVPLGIA